MEHLILTHTALRKNAHHIGRPRLLEGVVFGEWGRVPSSHHGCGVFEVTKSESSDDVLFVEIASHHGFLVEIDPRSREITQIPAEAISGIR